MKPSDQNVSGLLQAWSSGDLDARDRVLAVVYDELRRRAAAQLRHEQSGHTLQPTDLVHEAYLRLASRGGQVWQNRAHFMALASQVMRHVLVDHARARRASKRPGEWAQVSLSTAAGLDSPFRDPIDVLELDDALKRLAEFDARKSQIAELRFFGGLSLDEIGELMGVSSRTVERNWQAARAWLFKVLTAEPAESEQ